MKSAIKHLVIAGTALAATAGIAEARTNLSIGIGVPVGGYYEPAPVYVQPAPVYYEPVPYYQPYYPVYYRDGYYRHREYDYGYWNNRGGPRGPRGPYHR